MAEPSKINVIQLLNLDDAEVYETHQGQARLLAKGPLSLIYEKKHKWVLLKIADFNYGLTKKIPLLCSTRERGAFRAYVVPSKSDFYVIKIVNVWTISELLKLDEILKENTQFAYKDDFDTYPVHQMPRSNTQLSNQYISPPDYQRSQSYPATQQDWSHLTNNFYQTKQPTPEDVSRQQQIQAFEDDLSSKMIQLRGETQQSRQGIIPKKKSYTMPPQKPTIDLSSPKPVIDLSSGPEPTIAQPDDAHRIYAGGKSVRNAMVGSAHVISSGIKKMGGFIKKTFMKRKEGEEVQEMDESTRKQLTLASAAAGTIVTVSFGAIKAAMVATKIIGGQMSKRYEKKKSKAQTEENKEKLERKGSMTHAAVCTSMNMFSGMGEALGVIFGGVKDTTHDLVVHQHGEKAGSIVKASSGVFGLISLPGKKSQKTTN